MKEQRFFKEVFAACRADTKRIVLPESYDTRVVDAANVVVSRGIAEPILLVDSDVPSRLSDDVIVDHADPDDELIETLVDTRSEMSWQDAEEALDDPIVYAMTLVEAGRADGVVCGASHPSKKTYRDALRIIGPRDDVDVVSSVFFMFWHDALLFFADCALNISPSAEELAAIGEETVATAHRFNMSPRVAMLSYSTHGSGGGQSPKRVREATSILRDKCSCNVIGEVQFDAALMESVRRRKIGEAGKPCNVYIFPSLDAGNIGYKIAERMGGASAIGPITQGLRRPVNDLSRGCSVRDIVETVGITVYHA